MVRNLRTGRTSRVSVTTRGRPLLAHHTGPAISANGRYVAFSAKRSASAQWRVWLRDRWTDRTTLVSRRPDGAPFSAGAESAAISTNGRVVAFNVGTYDRAGPLFTTWVWARDLGGTELVSVSADGRPSREFSSAPLSLSRNGRYVSFGSYDALAGDEPVPEMFAGDLDAFVRDRTAGTTTRVSPPPPGREGEYFSSPSEITPDGRWFCLVSDAPLVSGDRNRRFDVMVRRLDLAGCS
jgi:hypothetical protein